MNITLPKLTSDLEVLKDLQKLMQSEETLTSAVVRNEDISKLSIRSFSANELRLEKVDVTEAKLERTSFSDVELINCELIATALPEASWRCVLVKGSQCSGLQLQTSILKDATFVGCKLNIANFRFSKLTNVRFRDCMLDEADFYSAELTNVVFENCSMDKTDFSSSKLKHVDLRTSEISGVSGIRSLAGATIDSAQLVTIAPVLASELNIKVDDN